MISRTTPLLRRKSVTGNQALNFPFNYRLCREDTFPSVIALQDHLKPSFQAVSQGFVLHKPSPAVLNIHLLGVRSMLLLVLISSSFIATSSSVLPMCIVFVPLSFVISELYIFSASTGTYRSNVFKSFSYSLLRVFQISRLSWLFLLQLLTKQLMKYKQKIIYQ